MAPSSDVTEFRKVLDSSKNIIVLSGAGLSAPSGIATYRGSSDSQWSDPKIVKYGLVETFKEDPSGSWQFYHHRRLICLDAEPNNGHLAIAALNLPSVMKRITPSAMVRPLHVTQNIDDLSLRSLQLLPESEATTALETLIQMHGSLFKTRCLSCNHVKHGYDRHLAASLKDCINPSNFIDISTDKLPRCGGDEWSGSNRFGRCGGLLRPDVVWFGEIPPLMGEIARKITWCDLLIVVGTSSTVQPASGFASQVKEHKGKVAIFDIHPPNKCDEADFLFLGSCDITLPEIFDLKTEVESLAR
ncbi:sirtuin [Phlegmacium glaucopus]|nr:sirtuin [Phlegmacium glaucopus]